MTKEERIDNILKQNQKDCNDYETLRFIAETLYDEHLRIQKSKKMENLYITQIA